MRISDSMVLHRTTKSNYLRSTNGKQFGTFCIFSFKKSKLQRFLQSKFIDLNVYKSNSRLLNMKCISCNKETEKIVKFPCPKCGHELIRCDKCRGLSIEYKCPKCGFVGP